MRRLIPIVYLTALMAYALAGTSVATFHGDEAMQVYMSLDYTIAFVWRDVPRLTNNVPYSYMIDSDEHLRILNGSVNRYAIGAAWAAAGYTYESLPPRPGWDWGMGYPDNEASGRRPPEPLMTLARLPSALFLALSIPVMFAIGALVGGKPVAYLASMIYALHPVILLNGRRAMQEGSMLFFGLACVLVALIIARRRADDARVSPLAALATWALLALVGGLTLTSKHSGVVFVVGALGGLLLAELTHLRLRRAIAAGVACALVAALSVALFVALSPALWVDPFARLADLLVVRADLLDIQVAVAPDAPTTIEQRVTSMLAQPFLTPAQHFEAEFYGGWLGDEIARYTASPFSGVQYASVTPLAIALTIAVLAGVVVVWRRPFPRAAAALLTGWLLAVIASLLVNPMPWQRYFLPLFPAAMLYAGASLYAVGRALWLQWGIRSKHPARPVATVE